MKRQTKIVRNQTVLKIKPLGGLGGPWRLYLAAKIVFPALSS